MLSENSRFECSCCTSSASKTNVGLKVLPRCVRSFLLLGSTLVSMALKILH